MADAIDDTVIKTDRLILRRVRPGDAALQHRLLNTPEVMKHLGGIKTLEEIEDKHRKTMALTERDGFGFMMLIERANGELVGHVGMKRVDNALAPNPGDHEIGWLVRQDRWRMGYAREAMQAVIGWAFETIGAPHLVALTSDANVGSWKLMEKLGMRRRRDLDFDDPAFPPEENPTIQYSLTLEAWEQQQ
jgi:RimJ/RimL family protein N-acetyltransferase